MSIPKRRYKPCDRCGTPTLPLPIYLRRGTLHLCEWCWHISAKEAEV